MEEYIQVYLFPDDERDSEEERLLRQIYTDIASMRESLEEDADILDDETTESLENELIELEEKVRLLKFIPLDRVLEDERKESQLQQVIQEVRPLQEVDASPTSKKIPEEAEELLSDIGYLTDRLRASLEEDRPLDISRIDILERKIQHLKFLVIENDKQETPPQPIARREVMPLYSIAPTPINTKLDNLENLAILMMLMKGRFEAEKATRLQQPIGMQLHQQLEIAGAYSRIEDPQKRGFLQTFLTTPQSMADIARGTNGQWSAGGVRKTLYASMQRVFPLLSEDTKQSLASAEEAIKRVAADEVKLEETRRKIRENERPSWKEEKPRRMSRKNPEDGNIGKTHRTNLSEAASRRWQRVREQAAQAQTPPADH